MQGILDDIKGAGATLVALTPQLSEHSKTMVERHKLGFDLLSDPGNDYADQLGVRFDVPPQICEIYRSFGINLDAHNGDDSWTLAIPGRVVAGADGIIKAAEFHPDYTTRPEPEEVLKGLAS